MLEPLIVLTALNCIFMFSSTVTTCALWWQYHGHRCCPRKTPQQKFDSKRSRSYNLQTVKKPGKSNFNDHTNVVSKSGTNGIYSREYVKNKRSQRKRSKKGLEYRKKSGEKISFPDELEIMKLDERAKMSEASQTINDTKSTVVMEFSTVQKVVQIVDADSDINSMRAPFKEIVIQKDTVNKKRDHNIDQKNFEAVAATDS